MLTHQALWAAIDRLAERHRMSVSGLAKSAGLNPTTFNRSKRVGRDGKPRWPSTESLSKILAVTDTLPELFLEDSVFTLPPVQDSVRASVRENTGAYSPKDNTVRESGALYHSPASLPELIIPAARFGQTRHTPLFDAAGFPCGEAWDEILFPELGSEFGSGTGEESLYALDIDDHSFAPTYRSGDRLIVSPTAAIRGGDRVVVGIRSGCGLCTVHIGDLLRITARRMDIRLLENTACGAHPETSPKATGESNILTVDTAPTTQDATQQGKGHWCARILWVRY